MVAIQFSRVANYTSATLPFKMAAKRFDVWPKMPSPVRRQSAQSQEGKETTFYHTMRPHKNILEAKYTASKAHFKKEKKVSLTGRFPSSCVNMQVLLSCLGDISLLMVGRQSISCLTSPPPRVPSTFLLAGSLSWVD